ncbi:MAG: RIP metalloprotease RseP, partial [Planctomycetaceae bacterium]
EKAGMKPGDVIANYGDLGTAPTQKQLYEINDKYADKGTNIVLERDGKLLPAKWIVPRADDKAKHALLGFVPVADMKHPIVGGIDTASPAYAAGLRGGDRITQINGLPVNDWLDIFVQLRKAEGSKVTISYLRNTQEGQAAIDELTPWMFDPNKYAIVDLGSDIKFRIMQVFVHKSDPVEAVEWGFTETVNSLLNTYVQVKSLFSGTIPVTELRGPLGIGGMAVQSARRGFSMFLYFMGVISVALAVLNFLPIPVVDGGHAAFLIAEKIRGKPISVKMMNIIQYIGLALLLGLFCVAMWNDISRWIKGMW